jgi:prepilin-type N-terminal cleavage/methylation domain-containing protein
MSKFKTSSPPVKSKIKKLVPSLFTLSNVEVPKDRKSKIKSGFTLIEVVAALLILSMILASVMVVVSQISDGMIDFRSETQAFAVARQNMEKLLSSPTVSDKSEYGILETNPDINWQTAVEPFYEPTSKRMWIRGVCTAAYTDSKGQRKTIELTCWLTGLTAQQIRQILDQQKRTEKWMEQFSQTDYGQQVTEQRKINLAFLKYKGLDVQGYQNFIEQIERRRIDSIAEHGFGEGYEDFAAQLVEDETDFLYRLGINYDEYVNFYETYDPETDYSQLRDQEKQQSSQEKIDTVKPADSSPDSGVSQNDTAAQNNTDTEDFKLPDNLPPEILEQLKNLK